MVILHEFAVEPEAMAEPATFFSVLGECGVENGRLIAKLPENWPAVVREHIDEAGDLSPVRKNMMLDVVSLQARWNANRAKGMSAAYSSPKVSPFAAEESYDANLDWLENAECAAEDNLCHAVLARQNPRENDRVILVGERTLPADGGRPNLWEVPTQCSIKLTRKNVTSVVGPLLRLSRHIKFVDPYFRPRGRWLRVIERCMDVAAQHAAPEQCEYHMSIERGKDDCFRERAKNIMAPTEAALPELLWQGQTLELVLWCEPDTGPRKGERPHDRFIMTEIGGLMFSYSLHERPEQTCLVVALQPDQWRDRWRAYALGGKAYELVYSKRVTGQRVAAPETTARPQMRARPRVQPSGGAETTRKKSAGDGGS